MTDTPRPGDGNEDVDQSEVVSEAGEDVVTGETLSGESTATGADDVIDPDTAATPAEAAASAGVAGGGEAPAVTPSGPEAEDEATHPDTVLAQERLADLQRLQAEYVNYKRRVDRDRATVQERAVADVIEALLPVLDDIHGARQHGDLEGGPFAAIAEKLEQTLGRFGVQRYGSSGEPFDPMQHEALMHTPWDPDNPDLPAQAEGTTVVHVLQPGYRLGERVVRPARVSVASPDGNDS